MVRDRGFVALALAGVPDAGVAVNELAERVSLLLNEVAQAAVRGVPDVVHVEVGDYPDVDALGLRAQKCLEFVGHVVSLLVCCRFGFAEVGKDREPVGEYCTNEEYEEQQKSGVVKNAFELLMSWDIPWPTSKKWMSKPPFSVFPRALVPTNERRRKRRLKREAFIGESYVFLSNMNSSFNI